MPKLSVGHSLVTCPYDILYIMTLPEDFGYCHFPDILIHQDFQTMFFMASIGVICSSARDAA